MSTVLILSCLWVIAASVTAFLPMRLQYAPGGLLLCAAPVLIIWLGGTHGWPWTVAGLLVVISLFRRPFAFCLSRFGARG